MNNKKNKAKSSALLFVILHISLLISSLSGVCSKMAGRQDTLLSLALWYGLGVLGTMGLYAIIWQQILKRLPLTVAYANKPVSLIWGMVWGLLIFNEKITPRMILGACIIFVGIWLVVTSEPSEERPGKS